MSRARCLLLVTKPAVSQLRQKVPSADEYRPHTCARAMLKAGGQSEAEGVLQARVCVSTGLGAAADPAGHRAIGHQALPAPGAAGPALGLGQQLQLRPSLCHLPRGVLRGPGTAGHGCWGTAERGRSWSLADASS